MIAEFVERWGPLLICAGFTLSVLLNVVLIIGGLMTLPRKVQVEPKLKLIRGEGSGSSRGESHRG